MSIQIQIAAYRDPELIKTVEHALSEAEHPENLVFGICNQQSLEDSFHNDLAKYAYNKQFRILNVPFEQARGACWARNKIQQMQDGEKYTMQLDSHMRFVKHWDTVLLNMFQSCLDESPWPILTTYVPSQEPARDPEGRVNEPWRMAAHMFTPEGCVFFLPEVIPDWQNVKKCPRARFFSAHFAFSWGHMCKNVPHDPQQYFHGEEISIAVRAQTHGQDLQHPNKVVCWHEQTRNGRRKQWDDDPVWWQKNLECHARNRKLMCVDQDPLHYQYSQGPFDLGRKRSLRSQERYAGLCFGLRKFNKQCLDKKEPPNGDDDLLSDEDWLKSFEGPDAKSSTEEKKPPQIMTMTTSNCTIKEVLEE